MANARSTWIGSIIKDHVLKSYGRGDLDTEPWRDLPEIPNSAEILGTDEDGNLVQEEKYAQDDLYGLSSTTRPDLPFNLVDQPWPDSASYIGAHYQLLREDAVYPLRKAVSEVKANPTMRDTLNTAIYTHVHIVGITLSNVGPAIKVEFSYENAGKRIRWEQSARLRQGTIVALTPRKDMFKTICKVAVVAARPLKDGVNMNPPRVDLLWSNWDEAEFDPTVNWVMVESRSGYWESFRHMGVALQKLRTESFPLSKYLVRLQTTIDAPDYVKRNPCTNMTSLSPSTPVAPLADDEIEGDPEFENVNILQPWPNMPSNLDGSQLDATKRILTKQIAIVQGPPGTGKTFVSVTSLKIMLNNWTIGDPPIIISAQTNHALDQLLLLLAPYVPDFIRLGGRTTDKTGTIQQRTIYEIRKAYHGAPGTNAANVRNAMDRIRLVMVGNLKLLMNNDTITGQDLLDLDLITQEQYDSLQDDSWATAYYNPDVPQTDIFNWAGTDQMCHLESKCPSINTTLKEEELDAQYETLNQDEEEAGSKMNGEDEIETLKGKFHLLKQSWVGERTPRWSLKKTKALLQSTSDLWDIPNDHRGEIYNFWIAEAKRAIRRRVRNDCKEYMRCVANSTICKWERDARMMAKLQIKVIGCTTTGLSKYRGLVAALQPRTLLIEEAAETVEGTVLAAIFESLDQLILVGDHKQLQAKPNRDELSQKPYSLSVSMFERLVNNGLQHTMLNKQRRMIPNIRKTFSHVYKGDHKLGIAGLSDHESVLERVFNRPPVPGMNHDLFFFSHVWPESRMDTSKCNHDEAEMIVNFFDYLVMNGVHHSKISILTFYKGQKKVLQKQLRSHHNLKGLTDLNVFTVDSYQGEENDIILLSLVRSNNAMENGFLRVQNRAVVSLSRARCGLYVFGNALSLVSHYGDQCWGVWSLILDVFRRKTIISEKLPLTCQKHGITTFVGEAADFEKMRITGGCQKKCHGLLPCGHACPHNCHPFGHERIICKEPCPKTLACGHPCGEKCGNLCCCLMCGPPSDEGYLSDRSDFEETVWAKGPQFSESIRQAIRNTPVRGSQNWTRFGNPPNNPFQTGAGRFFDRSMPAPIPSPFPAGSLSSLPPRAIARRSTENRRHGNFASAPAPLTSRMSSSSSANLPFPQHSRRNGYHHNPSMSMAIPHTSSMPLPSSSSSNLPPLQGHQLFANNGHHGNSLPLAPWAGWNAKKSDEVHREQRAAAHASAMNDSSRANKSTVIDTFRQVTLNNKADRSEAKKVVNKKHERRDPTAPRALMLDEQSDVFAAAAMGLVNLSLGDSTQQEHVQLHTNAPVDLLSVDFGDDFGSSSSAIQTGVKGNSVLPPALSTGEAPARSFAPQVVIADDTNANEQLDLLSFD